MKKGVKYYNVNGVDPSVIKLTSSVYRSGRHDLPDTEISEIFKDSTSKDNEITFEIVNNGENKIPNISEIRTSREKTFIDGNGNRFTYSGEKDEDYYPNRYGIIKYISGDSIGNEYFGMFDENYLPSGEGTMTLNDESDPIWKYSGTFSNGEIQPNHVTIIYKPNNQNNYGTYEGEFMNNFGIRPHGRGKMILSNLDEFMGDFALGVYEYGSMYYKNGNIKEYTGPWEHNKPNAYGRTSGNGIIIDNQNNRYEGDVIDGVYEGNGTMEYNDGSNKRFYHGMWINGQPSYGEMTYKDGRPPYQGPWENGEPNPPEPQPINSVTATPNGSPDRRRSPPKIIRKGGGRVVTRKYRNQNKGKTRRSTKKQRRSTIKNKKPKRGNKSRKYK
jgi:hypothetical protein